jgi:hypothetical protein
MTWFPTDNIGLALRNYDHNSNVGIDHEQCVDLFRSLITPMSSKADAIALQDVRVRMISEVASGIAPTGGVPDPWDVWDDYDSGPIEMDDED